MEGTRRLAGCLPVLTFWLGRRCSYPRCPWDRAPRFAGSSRRWMFFAGNGSPSGSGRVVFDFACCHFHAPPSLRAVDAMDGLASVAIVSPIHPRNGTPHSSRGCDHRSGIRQYGDRLAGSLRHGLANPSLRSLRVDRHHGGDTLARSLDGRFQQRPEGSQHDQRPGPNAHEHRPERHGSHARVRRPRPDHDR